MSDADAKPLHVQVAEALGWRPLYRKHGYWAVKHGWSPEGVDRAVEIPTCHAGYTFARGPYDPRTGERLPDHPWWEDCPHIPHFDTDWSVTGPLIKALHICLDYDSEDAIWYARFPTWGHRYDADPLVATCLLIIVLKQHGKLPALEDLT